MLHCCQSKGADTRLSVLPCVVVALDLLYLWSLRFASAGKDFLVFNEFCFPFSIAGTASAAIEDEPVVFPMFGLGRVANSESVACFVWLSLFPVDEEGTWTLLLCSAAIEGGGSGTGRVDIRIIGLGCAGESVKVDVDLVGDWLKSESENPSGLSLVALRNDSISIVSIESDSCCISDCFAGAVRSREKGLLDIRMCCCW